jgi:hypothetical protein
MPKHIKIGFAVAVMFALVAGCEVPRGAVDKSSPTGEFEPIGGNDLKAVCIDGVQYWRYRASLAPRYSKETKEVVLCDMEASKQ